MNEKYLSERRNPLVCWPTGFVSTKKFSTSLLKSVLPFLTNQAVRFILCGIGHSYFSGNFLLSFLLWYDFKILVKSRGGGTFLYLASSVNIQQKQFFFQLKAKYPIFHFLDLDRTILNLIKSKINKKMSKFPLFFKVFLILPPVRHSNFGSCLSIDNI